MLATGTTRMKTVGAPKAPRKPKAPNTPKAPKPIKPMSAAQRNKLATKGILVALGLPDEGEKAAVIAAIEAVCERLAADAELRETVRQKYQEIEALGAKPRQASDQRSEPDLGSAPIPIRSGTPEEYNPYAAFDPYVLVWEYGEHQLRRVLELGTQRDLRDAVGIVQKHQPGTAPRTKVNNADMVDYIMEQVVGPGF